jgi:type IV pilus assembly protein PilB
MSGAPPGKRIGELLIERGLITRVQLEEALAQQRSSREFLGAILVRLGLVTEDALTQTLSARYGIPLEAVDPQRVDWALVGRFPDSLLTEGKGFPIRGDAHTVVVAVLNPLDAWTLSAFQRIAGSRTVRPVLVLARDLQAVLRAHKQRRLQAIAARLEGPRPNDQAH